MAESQVSKTARPGAPGCMPPTLTKNVKVVTRPIPLSDAYFRSESRSRASNFNVVRPCENSARTSPFL